MIRSRLFQGKLQQEIEVRFSDARGYLNNKRMAQVGERVDVLEHKGDDYVIAVSTMGGYDDVDVVIVPTSFVKHCRASRR
jgi:hypothetical protein